MNNKKLVVKSNHLIESRYKLPVIAQKVLLGCAMQVRSTDDFNNKLYTISVDEYKDIFGVNSNSTYENLRDAVNKLWDSSFYIVDEDGVEVENRWITSRKRDKRKNYVGIKFHNDIKEFIYQLTKKFTAYKIENISQLKSVYSIRLYELMKQYEKIGWRKIDYAELRKILSIKPNEYELFGDFNRRVLKQSQKEINENTDILFEYEKMKDGRKVSGIRFKIRKQTKPEQALDPKPLPVKSDVSELEDQSSDVNQELLENLVKFGVPKRKAIGELKKDEQRVKMAFDAAVSYIEKQGEDNIQNIAGVVNKAITDGWGAKSPVELEKEEKRKAYKEEVDRTEAKKRFEDEYYLYRDNIIENVRKDLPSDRLKELETQATQAGNEKKKKRTFGSVDTFIRLELNSLLEKETNILMQEEWVENKMKVWEENKNEKHG